MAKINFFALGGLDERGKNLYCVEVDQDIFIFDAGTKNPERGILGIDVVIPNFDYLKENKQRIKGIFISKPSDECSEAITYILKELPLQVYGSDLTCSILNFHLQRFKVRGKEELFTPISAKQIIDFGQCQIEVFLTTTSMPNSFGFALHTPDGTIIYTGDYMFDAKADTNFSTDLQHLQSIVAKQKILLFLSEATAASRQDYTAPNHKINIYVERAVKEAKGRIILACFDQDLHKISELFDLVRENNISAGIYGQTLLEALKVLRENKKMNLDGINLVPLHEAVSQEKSLIIVTGSGERLYSRLIKIAGGNDDILDIKETDMIILATPPTPGSELNHANVLDELARTVAKTIALSAKKVWTMNASFEDVKLMTSIIKPTYFIPVKGLYKDFVWAKTAAIEAGVNPENIFLCDNGENVEFVDGTFAKKTNRIKTADLYVDGIGVGDIGAVVLNERKQLATDGVVIVGVSVDSKTKEIASLIDTQMRGVIYIQENNDIFKKMQKIITDIVEKHHGRAVAGEMYDINEVKNEIRSVLATFVKTETGKTPIILAIVNEI
ncbi:ribonuclease J [Spiroplasma chrysopicola]|uniref:Metallo-beta-lactamase superfamily hydrolase n=1 Tax=Spiroplasma chrysopicola DF-1 TaxID=1276227 RepID=R4UHG1_9MOLU|nr:ribonuclease J [Spiroplasma chrysopicola]AGM24766.1 metallo-beta-lactamase superfamily hydrolase [Spiroplasma chrysopicola DF-1]